MNFAIAARFVVGARFNHVPKTSGDARTWRFCGCHFDPPNTHAHARASPILRSSVDMSAGVAAILEEEPCTVRVWTCDRITQTYSWEESGGVCGIRDQLIPVRQKESFELVDPFL